MKARQRIRNMTIIALGAVCMTICAWITVPFAIPFTLQSFGLFLLIFCFGAKKAFYSVLLYIAIGSVGIPVFSGFGAGIAVLFGPTGGFILGFLAATGVYFVPESIFKSSKAIAVIGSTLSLAACYTLGTVWMLFFADVGSKGFFGLMTSSVLVFIVPDMLKIILAYFVAKYLKRVLKLDADLTAV